MLQLEKLIGTNYFLNTSAKEAYKSYVRAYDSHHLKTIFDIGTLALEQVALSFGFRVPPSVDLRILLNNNLDNCVCVGLVYDFLHVWFDKYVKYKNLFFFVEILEATFDLTIIYDLQCSTKYDIGK